MRNITVTQTEVRLHVVETDGPDQADQPTVVFVHGFPDNHQTWLPVIEALAGDVAAIAYDVRGAGASSAPAHRAGYRIDRLADDLVAVLDATRPNGSPVHLVGHDWGSVQLWGILQNRDPRLRGRIASFTSISGPPLELYARYLAGAALGPDRRGSFRQLSHSWYVGAFQVPGLAEFVFGRFADRLGREIGRREGVPDLFGPSLARDGANGVNLYRVNRPARSFSGTDVPVQLIVPQNDAFVGAPLMEAVAEQVGPERRTDLDAGHWVTHTHPAALASAIRTFVEDSTG